ncbi:MAG: DUF362 domain-containing protein [Armatimonadota bacterium]
MRSYCTALIGALLVLSNAFWLTTPACAGSTAPGKAVVGIGRNEDPQTAAEEAIRLAGGLQGIVKRGDWVVVKPNMTVPGRSGDGVITHAGVLKAVILAAKAAGAGRITVAESGGAWRGEGALRQAGYDTVLQETGAEWLNIHTAETKIVKPDRPLGMPEYRIAKAVMDCDVFISVAVLKTHNTAQVTMSMKNLFGIVPGSKNYIHVAKRVEESIVDLCRVRPIHFAVVDGTTAMEGYGPISGNKVKMNIVLAGRDPVAVDSVGAEIMGFNPAQVKHIHYASKAGLGTMDLSRITVRGAQIAELKRRFARPWGPGLEGEITRSYVPPNGVTLFWLGQGGFAFKTPDDKVIVVDPYLSDSGGMKRMVPKALHPRDVRGDAERQQQTLFPSLVLCTHDHVDHTDLPGLQELAATSSAVFAGPPSSCAKMKEAGIDAGRIVDIKRGDAKTLAGVDVRAVFAKHTQDSVGYVLTIGKTRIYITGDSEYDAQLAQVKSLRPDILLVCINGKWGNMSAQDAARLTAQINPKVVIPMHFGMFADNTVDPQTFVEAAKKSGVKSKIVILPHMGSFVYEP